MSSIPIIGYRDRSDQPWPWILRVIAITALIYAAGRAGSRIYEAQSMLRSFTPVPLISVIGASYVVWWMGVIVEMIAGALLMIGAIQLVGRRSQRPILLALWAMMVSSVLELAADKIFPSQQGLLSHIFSAINTAIRVNIFPAAAILFLRLNRLR